MAKQLKDVMSPIEAYLAAAEQKKKVAEDFVRQLLVSVGKVTLPASQEGEPVVNLANRFIQLCGANIPEDKAIRQAYGEMVFASGMVKVNPLAKNFKQNLNRFYQLYIRSFPIKEEQMAKDDFKTILKEGKRSDGCQEVMYFLECPLTGQVIGGWQGVINPGNNSAIIWYAFISPHARGMGLLSLLLKLVRQVVKEAVSQHKKQGRTSPFDTPILLIECNDISQMSLEHIILDSAGVEATTPPRHGQDLTSSAIEQHLRDLAWSRVGALDMGTADGKLITYYMPDLEQVTNIDKKNSRLVAQYLNHDDSLTKSHLHLARKILKKATGRHCGGYPLNLRLLAEAGQTSVHGQQVLNAIRVGYGYSAFVYDKKYKSWKKKGVSWLADQDVYMQALAMSIADHQKNGKLSLIPIKPFGPAGMEPDFIVAANHVRQVIAQIPTWSDKRLKITYLKAVDKIF